MTEDSQEIIIASNRISEIEVLKNDFREYSYIDR